MESIDTAALKEQLAQTIGPAPWYGRLSRNHNPSGQRLVWDTREIRVR